MRTDVIIQYTNFNHWLKIVNHWYQRDNPGSVLQDVIPKKDRQNRAQKNKSIKITDPKK